MPHVRHFRTVAALLLAAVPLAAHDFWIVPNAFQVAAGSALSLRSVTGTSLLIRHRPASAGQRVVAASLVPSSRRLSGDAIRAVHRSSRRIAP